MASSTNRVMLNGVVKNESYTNEGMLRFNIEMKFENDGLTKLLEHEVQCTKAVSLNVKLSNGDRVTICGHLGSYKFEIWNGVMATRTIVIASNIEKWD